MIPSCHATAAYHYIFLNMGIKNTLSLFFLIVAGLLLLVGAVQAVGTAVFLSGAEETIATVIDYEIVQNAAPFMATSGGAGRLFYAILQFETPQGELATFTADQGHRSRPYEVEASVPILYSAEKPQNSRVADFWGLWGRVVIFGGLGIAFGLIGVITPLGFSRSGRNPFHRDPEA
jgi:hypothetical protein